MAWPGIKREGSPAHPWAIALERAADVLEDLGVSRLAETDFASLRWGDVVVRRDRESVGVSAIPGTSPAQVASEESRARM